MLRVAARRFGTAAYPEGSIFPRLDFNLIKNSADQIQKNADRRQSAVDVAKIVHQWDLFQNKRKEVTALRSKRKSLSSTSIGMQAPSDTESQAVAEEKKEQGRDVKKQMALLETELENAENELYTLAARLPNNTHAAVGDQPITLRQFLSQNDLTFSKEGFTPASHMDIGAAHDLFDFETATNIAGSKFVVFKNEAALLELALVNFTLQKLISKGFTPCLPPDLAQSNLLEGTGFQPRSSNEKQTFEIRDHNLCLIGTSEIPLAAMYRNRIIKPDKEELPIRLCAFSHCFRTEVGHTGAATKGAYRLHQFSKVEMFALSTPAQSDQVFDELVSIQEEIFQELQLHYRVLEMPADDLGHPAARKIDIEAWMPQHAGGSYGEISSASNCTDYQSRRLAIRYKDAALDKNQYVHTLNATGCAVPRLIVAILEQHQQKDGTVKLPTCLTPFMMGATQIPFLPRKR